MRRLPLHSTLVIVGLLSVAAAADAAAPLGTEDADVLEARAC